MDNAIQEIQRQLDVIQTIQTSSEADKAEILLLRAENVVLRRRVEELSRRENDNEPGPSYSRHDEPQVDIPEMHLDALMEKYSNISVSHPETYRGINWGESIEHVRGNKWQCLLCKVDLHKKKPVIQNRQNILSHVFVIHFHGRYICNGCDKNSSSPNHANKHCK